MTVRALPSHVIAWALVALLLATAVGLAYLWVDRSITASYLHASVKSTAEAKEQAVRILAHEWNGQTADQVFLKLQLIRGQSTDVVLKSDPSDGSIQFGYLVFKFQNNKLVGVS